MNFPLNVKLKLCPSNVSYRAIKQHRHCEKQSDEAIPYNYPQALPVAMFHKNFLWINYHSE